MTEEQYIQRHSIIMDKIYRHSDAFANGKPKFPLCLRADMAELKKLNDEWLKQNQ